MNEINMTEAHVADCDVVRAFLIDRRAAGEDLPPHVAAHLRECEACRREYEANVRAFVLLGELGTPVLSPAVAQRLARPDSQDSRARYRAGRRAIGARELVAAVGLVVVLLMVGNQVFEMGRYWLQSRTGSAIGSSVPTLPASATPLTVTPTPTPTSMPVPSPTPPPMP